MAKKRLTIDQRGRIAEKVMELGNLVFGGLILGQALSGKFFDPRLAFSGVIGAIIAYVVAVRIIMKGGGK